MARIAVIGLGYVGLTSMVAFAELGHSVVGIDLDDAKLALLKKGLIHFHEPGLKGLLAKHLGSGKFLFATSYDDAPKDFDFAFICASTPSSQSGQADLSYVQSAMESVVSIVKSDGIVVIKSTVPIGTCAKIQSQFSANGIRIVSNPEFLSEGTAIEDFFKPSRIVVGALNQETAREVFSLYKGIEATHISCDLTSAESIKYASNAFLAVKLSFVNEIAALCQATGASMSDVSRGMGLDPRIGEKFLRPGPGWGGSCFPKDTSELALSAQKFGSKMLTVEAAIESNRNTIARTVERLSNQLGGKLTGAKVAIWGLSFKANTDDIRESPAIEIAALLAKRGATIVAYDPLVKDVDLKFIEIADSSISACIGATALMVLTECDEFGFVDPREVQKAMAPNPAIYDGRNILSAEEWARNFKNFMSVGN